MSGLDVLRRATAVATSVVVLAFAGQAAAQRREPARESAAPPASSPEEAVRSVFRGLAGEIVQHAKLKGKTIGVMAFLTSKGVVTEAGAHLSDILEVELVRMMNRPGEPANRPAAVVARKDLCEVIRENKLWLADRFDPKLHEKLGGLSEADFLATGRVVERGRSLVVTVRLVDTERGRQAWAEQVKIPLDEGLRKLVERSAGDGGCEEAPGAGTVAQPASDVPHAAAGPSAASGASNSAASTTPPVASAGSPASAARPGAPVPLEVRAWFDKQAYRVGDEIRIGVRVNRDAYVTLVNVGTSGKVSVLFPNAFHPDNFVRANQDVLVPPTTAFALTVDGPTGFDQVIAIATEERTTFIDTDFAKTPGAFRPLAQIQTRSIVVGTKALRKTLPPDKMAEHVIAVEIGPAAPPRSDDSMQQ